jgi:hypothetical protein
VNVDRRWWATSVVRVRVLAGVLMVVGAGCAVLGWGSRSGHTASRNLTAEAMSGPLGMTSAAVPASAVNSGANPNLSKPARALFAGMPLFFEPNQGQGGLDQSDPRARFVSRGSGYALFLGSEGAILSLVSHDRPSKGAAT